MAAIELLLSVALFVTIVMLALGAMKLGSARLQTGDSAAFEAFNNAAVGQTPQYTGDSKLQPIDGIGAIRPGLPNRTHVPRPTTQVSVNPGNKETLKPVQISGKAGAIGPSWTYSAYPFGGDDEQATQNWFQDEVNDSHAQLTDPLRLAPAWTP